MPHKSKKRLKFVCVKQVTTYKEEQGHMKRINNINTHYGNGSMSQNNQKNSKKLAIIYPINSFHLSFNVKMILH